MEGDEFVRDPVKFSNQSTIFDQAFSDFSPSTKKGMLLVHFLGVMVCIISAQVDFLAQFQHNSLKNVLTTSNLVNQYRLNLSLG